MPAIRDGRGKLTVHENEPPPAVPSGPIERRRVSAARMADFAAERAAAARRQTTSDLAASRARGQEKATEAARQQRERSASVPPGDHHDAGSGRVRQQVADGAAAAADAWPQGRTAEARAERTRRILDAVRTTPSLAAAAEKVGLGEARVAQVTSELRRTGALPADVDELLRRRSGHKPKPAAATIESEDREASAPATAAVDRGAPDASGSTEVATPPGPPDVVAPCEDCAHVAVCAIRALLDMGGWREQIAAATPFPAIRITAVSVTCDHFLEVRA